MHSAKGQKVPSGISEAEVNFLKQILPINKDTKPNQVTNQVTNQVSKDTKEKSEFPFNPEEYRLRLPSWYTGKDSMEIPSISNGYVIVQDNRSPEETGGTTAIQARTTTSTTLTTNQNTNFNLELPYTGSMINPKIFFDIQTHMEIQYIVNKTSEKNSEVALYQLIFPMNQYLDFYCSDFILMGQDASGASVDIDGDHHDKILNYLSTEYKDILGPNVWNYLHHAHSHPNMGVGRSGTDKNNEETRSQQGYKAPARFFTIYNNRGEISTRYFQYPHGDVKIPIKEFKNVSLGVHIPQGSPVKLTKARMEELDALIKKYVVTKSFSSSSTSLFPKPPSSFPTFKSSPQTQTSWENTYRPKSTPDADFFSDHPAVVSDYLGNGNTIAAGIEDISASVIELVMAMTPLLHPNIDTAVGKLIPAVDRAITDYFQKSSTYSGELPALVQMCEEEDDYYQMQVEYRLKKYGEAFSHWITKNPSTTKLGSTKISEGFLNSLYTLEFVAEEYLNNSFFSSSTNDFIEEELNPKDTLFPLYMNLANKTPLNKLIGEKEKDQFITNLLHI